MLNSLQYYVTVLTDCKIINSHGLLAITVEEIFTWVLIDNVFFVP